MGELINAIIESVVQIFIFTLIPFIFYLFRKDKSVSFFKYIGLYAPGQKSIRYALLTSLLFLAAGIGMIFISDSFKELLLSPPTVTGKLRVMGVSTTTILILLITAWLKTSFAEEIFFRGFIARQLINKFGLTTGNIIQAVIFGLVHLLLFLGLTEANVLLLIFIFVFPTLAGWVIGLVKEKFANGSIIPGWIAHGLGNTLSYSIIVFLL